MTGLYSWSVSAPQILTGILLPLPAPLRSYLESSFMTELLRNVTTNLSGSLVIALILIFLRWLFSFLMVLNQTRGQPGLVSIFRPYHFVASVLLPHHWRISIHRSTHWNEKDTLFRKYNSSALLVTSLFPPSIVCLISHPDAIAIVASDRQTFGKTGKEQTKAAAHWGENILIAPDGPAHRRHRKVAAPAFSEANNAEVWRALLAVTKEWFGDIDRSAQANNGVAVLERVEDYLQLMTLIVIGRAGFGVDFRWDQHDKGTVTSMNFFDATKTMLQDFVPDALLPSWAFSLPSKYLRRVRAGFDKFDETIRNLLKARRDDPSTAQRHDILGLLVASNDRLTGKDVLTEKEMLSDIFTFLFAGHDTTSNSLSGLLLLLALHPEHQTLLYAEISAVLENNEDHSYETTYRSLPYTLACVQQGLRLAGPVPAVVKSVKKYTMLPSRTLPSHKSGKSEKFLVAVPEGSAVQSCSHAAHYTEEYWPDADVFKPSRWLGEEDSGSERQACRVPFFYWHEILHWSFVCSDCSGHSSVSSCPSIRV